MATTYTLINSNVLSSSAASVTFSSIPADYTDLVIRASIRNIAASTTNLTVRVNGLTTTIYSSTFVFGDGSSAYSGRRSNATGLVLDDAVNDNGSTSNTFSSFELYLPSYTASQNKPVSSFYTQETNATNTYINANGGLIRTTATITEMSLALATGSLASGSSFYLYGISNA